MVVPDVGMVVPDWRREEWSCPTYGRNGRARLGMFCLIHSVCVVLAQSYATLLPSASGCEWGGMLRVL